MRRTAGIGASVAGRRAALLLAALLAALLGACASPYRMSQRLAWSAAAPAPMLGPADFHGHYVPRLEPAWHGLQSTYSGMVAVTMIERALVQKMLPPGLSLAQPRALPDGAIPDRHPVLHMIGDQREPATLVAGFATQVGPGYEEMILLVPFVVRGSGKLWHNYVARMYLNSQVAVDGGNQLFGYAKELARLDRSDGAGVVHHTVSAPDLATTWFRNDVEITGPWGALPAAQATLPRWQDLREILAMPVLGLRPAGGGLPAALICSYWEFDEGNAALAATVSRHQVVTRLRPGMEAWETMGTLTSAPDGAVSMRNVRWRLAVPPPGC